jgi:hypothetical protein
MDNLPFDLVGLDASEVDSLDAVYKALRDKFAVKVPDDFNIDVNKFDSIKFYENTDRQSEVTVGGVLQIDNCANDCYVVFVKIRYYYPPNSSYHTGERLDYYKYLVWALVNQKKDFGRALIRKETFTDRILSIVHPVELEFKDDKAFSHKFYVVANEPEKATNCINWNFRNALIDIDLRDLVIEIVGDDLIIGNNDWLNPDTAVYSTKIAGKIAAVC